MIACSHRQARLRAGLVLLVTLTLAGGALAAPVGLQLTSVEKLAMLQVLGADPLVEPGGPATDAMLWDRVVRFGQRELGQRVQPSRLDPLWAMDPPQRDVETELLVAHREDRISAWLQTLSPPNPQYAGLILASRRYQALARSGGWLPLPKGLVGRAGSSHAGILALRARLSLEGYDVPISRSPEVFDAGLVSALKQFQGHHGLLVDGVVGPLTRAELDVPAETRVLQIEANLERWRWMPRNLPADRVEVDIAGAEAVLFRGQVPIFQSRVVVGRPHDKTPMFVSRLNAIVLNPPWNVPTGIANTEILPKAAKDPKYLSENDFIWVDGHLQQKAGPKSALGLIKFDLVSPFGVYLHDTPLREVFSKPSRALSHGCMRVEKPLDLATLLLTPQGMTLASLQAAIDAKETLRIALNTPTPLYVRYWTAVVDPGGQVSFRPDVYDWDRRLITALALGVSP